ncbi:MAG: TetR family transcriptional regulator [Actinobacteria bacterium]|jgi:AcrR family transcriptional regulator|uniref:Unannotated protein n=1 Tax=freshwater metagenome TaxID=449393 RepID=A0A6J6AC94_9ZZZZ|nr:TetR family transcriptional regulator [Actinomycetota bacterium]MSW79482.1 TetR family transcriptional regulator [Actinomycetota bacterium]MSX56729.1 TetR family transcriptional regulator [Actinomycetota bacterium]MSX94421.1 TetR family transcriptional regulator [Actinomycetota bacterium]MSZ84632.1 TetR family transcriptional regulator [Actinomycetota bacterium]
MLVDSSRRLTKGERTRQRLLSIAIDEFGARGYKDTSVSTLSRSADLTPAAAYAYFADKHAFWEAAVEADLDALYREVGQKVRNSKRPLMDAVFGVLDGMSSHPLAHRLLSDGSNADLQLFIGHRTFVRLRALIVLGLCQRRDAGMLPPGADPELLARGVETVLTSFVLATVRAGLEHDGDRTDALVSLLQAACGGPPLPTERFDRNL